MSARTEQRKHIFAARTAIEPHPVADLASDDPEAIVLDFVQPIFGRRTAAALMSAGMAE